jgi:tetratricopeptide (TPR) repeat protein
LAVELKRQFAPARRMRRWLVARPRLTLTALTLFALACAAAGSTWAVIPPYGERQYKAGKKAYRAGRYDEAEQHFEHALSREPDNLRWRRALGWARLKVSNSLPYDQARDKMDQAFNDLKYCRDAKSDDSILEPMAYLQVRLQSFAVALDFYSKLAKLGPLSATQLNNRAFCCIQLELVGLPGRGMLAEAEADLETAGAMTSNCQAIYYNRATIALKKGGASQESLNDIERAVQLGPATYALYRDAALLYGRAAEADLRRAPVMLDAPIATALFFEARSRRIERALYYARESIALGQYPGQFKLKLFRNLVPPATLSELLAMKPPPVAAPIELRLIEPAGELD